MTSSDIKHKLVRIIAIIATSILCAAIIHSVALCATIKDFTVSQALSTVLSEISSAPIEERTDVASRLLISYVEKNPDDVLARFFHARTLYDQLYFDLAAAEAGEALARAPEFADAHALSASILFAKYQLSFGGAPDESLALAGKAIEKAIAIEPGKYDFHVTAAGIHSAMGMSHDALKDIENAIDLIPAAPSLYHTRAELLIDNARPHAALLNLNIALYLCTLGNDQCVMPRIDLYQSIQSTSIRAASAISMGESLYAEGRAKAAVNDMAGAASAYASASIICSDCSSVAREISAITSSNTMNIDEKIDLYRNVAEVVPMDADIRLSLCKALLEKYDETNENTDKESVDQCNTAASVIPALSRITGGMSYCDDNVGMLLTTGKLMRAAGMKREAVAVLLAASFLGPENKDVIYELNCLKDGGCTAPEMPVPSNTTTLPVIR